LPQLAQTDPPVEVALRLSWQKIFLCAAGVLASTVLLKVGAIQYLELIYFALAFVLLLIFVEHGYKARWYRLIVRLSLGYAVFCAIALGLALAALRLPFYLPLSLPAIKGPVAITLARIAELVASLIAMFYMTQTFAQSPDKARFTMRIYFWTGIASGIFSLLSLPLDIAGVGIPYISLGAYSNIHRLRGFYNEGGPYGLYALSVLVVGYALDHLGWLPRRTVRLALGLMCLVFVMCYSKAGMVAVLGIFVINGLLASSISKRVAILVLGGVALVGFSHVFNLSGALRRYQETSAQYERLSHYHVEDPNFVYGRVAGAYIVPRMIAEHPLTGVGWGNYGLVRNAPEYRGAAVFTEDADDPGLGMFGLAAELGLPLLAFLLILLLVPFIYMRRIRAPTWMANLALVQPLVHVFGAQLNLTYPWVMSAFALGLGLSYSRTRPYPAKNVELQVS
jgi:O-antigen ligase